MDEYTELPSLPYSSDPQKKAEMEWLGKWLATIEQNQREQFKAVNTIKIIVLIYAILSLLGAIVSLCNSVMSL